MSLTINLPPEVEKKMRESFAHFAKECKTPEALLYQRALEFYLEDLEDAVATRKAIEAGEPTIPWDEIKQKYVKNAL